MSSGESLRFQWKTVQSFNNHSGYSIFQFENNVNFVKRDNNFTSLFGSTRKIGLNVKWVVFSSTTGRSFLLVTETFPTGDKFVSSNSSYSSGKVVQLSKRWKVLFTREFLMDWDRSLQGRFETLWWKYLRTLGNLSFARDQAPDLVMYLESAGSLCAILVKHIASVSHRDIARKLEREQKKMEEARGGEVFFSPLSLRGHCFFLALSSQLSRPTRAETLATQAEQWYVFCGRETHCLTYFLFFNFLLLYLWSFLAFFQAWMINRNAIERRYKVTQIDPLGRGWEVVLSVSW